MNISFFCSFIVPLLYLTLINLGTSYFLPVCTDISEICSLKQNSQYLHAVLLHASAGFEVGADALAGSFLELRELSAAGLDDGLDLLLGLFGDGNHPVQVLVHEQTHEHLQGKTAPL